MRYRVLGAIGASAAALAAAPATASACASFGSVKSFEGHARVSFSAQASGPNEPGQAQYGTESVTLKRDLSSLHINLNHKHATRLGILMFTGPASGGSVTIKDTFDDTRGN